MDPRLHLNIAELVAGGREKTESYTWAPKASPGNDSSLLLTVYLTKKIHHVVVHDFNRMEMYNLPSGKTPMWVKSTAVSCFSIILSSTYLPSLLEKRFTIPYLKSLGLDAF